MIKYKYAQIEGGEIVKAQSLRGNEIPRNLVCLGCGEQLIARVNGKKIAPHFAHKVSQECSNETYLHNLAKRFFYRKYRECLDSGEPFFLTIHHIKRCQKYEKIEWEHCPNLGHLEKDYDLTSYYRDISLETQDGQFVPDLLLTSSKEPEKPIYVEIAVTHFLSEEKESSDNRIIEIPIESEDDLEIIDHRRIGSQNARLVNFNEETSVVSDSECRCAETRAYGFFLYRSGKAILRFDPLAQLLETYRKYESSIAYSSFFSKDDSRCLKHGKKLKRGQIFSDQLYEAESSGVEVKHCLMCKFHGGKRSAFQSSGVYCKYFKKAVPSEQALECDVFSKYQFE